MLARTSIPNLLTGARVLAVPLALGVMLLGGNATALFSIFLIAACTDFLDGYLARRWRCTSAFGALADPVADKLLVALMLLHLLQMHDLPLLPVAVIILREIYVSALRDFISGRGGILPVSQGGKWKTAVQMLSLTSLLAAVMLESETLWNFGALALWVAAGLAISSATSYSRAARPYLRANG